MNLVLSYEKSLSDLTSRSHDTRTFFHWSALTRKKSQGMLPKLERRCPYIWQTKDHALNGANKVRCSVRSRTAGSPFSYDDALYRHKCISFSESQRNAMARAGFSTVLDRRPVESNNHFIIILTEYYISCYLYKISLVIKHFYVNRTSNF